MFSLKKIKRYQLSYKTLLKYNIKIFPFYLKDNTLYNIFYPKRILYKINGILYYLFHGQLIYGLGLTPNM